VLRAGGLDSGPMLALSAFNSTFGLLVTFLGIGLLVNGLIVYMIALVLGERAENRRRAESEADRL
jgi:hypothetical protein